jgi:integrase
MAPPSEFVFPSERNAMKRLDSGAINKRIEAYGKVLGIEDAHPHRFRATFINDALDAGIAPHKVQASVHHADPKTTQRYDRRQRGLDVASDLAEFRKAKR